VMKAIWKYPLIPPTYNCRVEMPIGSTIVDVREQNDQVNMWAEVDTDAADMEIRTFAVFGTGHILPNRGLKYVGTAHLFHGELVMHVFEVTA